MDLSFRNSLISPVFLCWRDAFKRRCCPSLAAGLALFVTGGQAEASELTRKPNIIFFLVDDMGWMDCGVYGSQYYETPNIDRFASQAMRFTDAYAQPLCSPTRASLLTGQSPARHGVTTASGHQPPQPTDFEFLRDSAPASQPMLLPESKNYLDPLEYTIAEALRDAGYRTAHIGKWHLGLLSEHRPEQQGFDVTFHCAPDGSPPSYFSPYGVSPDGEPKGMRHVGNITDGPPGEYIGDRLTDEAIKFIEANKDRPFFLNLWQYGVHGPWGHKLEYTEKFASKKDPRGVQSNPIMASMLKSVDDSFGRILETVEKLGIAENTIIIFNSDNGGNTKSCTATDTHFQKRKPDDPLALDWRKWADGLPPTNNAPLRGGKGSLYEGGTRVPLMWSWPGHIKPGTTSGEVVGHMDLYPTLLDLLGVSAPPQQKFDGVSYARVLQSEGKSDRVAFFNYFPHRVSKLDFPGGGVSVRAEDWKLIRWFAPQPGDAGRYELYHLREDLSETKNLAAENPDRVKELNALIDGFLKDTGALYPRPNPAYDSSAADKPVDPLQGWILKSCTAVVANGALRVEVDGKAPFLGCGLVEHVGPCAVKLQLRSTAGGDGKIQWRTAGQQTLLPEQAVGFQVPGDGEWHEIEIALPVNGTLNHFRLHLPADKAPVDLASLDFVDSSTGRIVRSWRF